jgi:prepilin-type N-terminal cleavage/methylation domain-containing protein
MITPGERNQKGFTLMEVMVAIAVLTLVSAGIVTLISQMGTVATFYSAKQDYDAVYRSAQLLVVNDVTCKSAFLKAGAVIKFNPAGAGPWLPVSTRPQFPIDQIVMVDPLGALPPVTMFQVGKNPSTRIGVAKMYLWEALDAGGLPAGRGFVTLPLGAGFQAYRSYSAELNIAVSNVFDPTTNTVIDTRNGRTPIAIKPVPLTVVVDASDQIISCFSQTSTSAICEKLGQTVDPLTGQCKLPECWAGMASPPACPTIADPSTGTVSCSNPYYFLAFQNNPSGSTPSQPSCQCVQTCSLPGAAGPAGPVLPPAAPAPFAPPPPVFGGY